MDREDGGQTDKQDEHEREGRCDPSRCCSLLSWDSKSKLQANQNVTHVGHHQSATEFIFVGGKFSCRLMVPNMGPTKIHLLVG